MRYFFEIAYNGKNYHGWQNQANATGVQQVVEETLSKLLRDKVSITGSGRTDTGVHCRQQFFHVDVVESIDRATLLQRLNSFLPRDIAIRDIVRVTDTAHARYDARERVYEYCITKVKDPFREGGAFYFFRELDITTMNRAAALMLGEHDFESFSKVKTDVNHFTCNIKKARWIQKEQMLIFTISANRFLRGMVRAIVGTLLDVGTGKISVKDFQRIIEARDRKLAGMNVPPEGLYLIEVKYPKRIFPET